MKGFAGFGSWLGVFAVALGVAGGTALVGCGSDTPSGGSAGASGGSSAGAATGGSGVAGASASGAANGGGGSSGAAGAALGGGGSSGSSVTGTEIAVSLYACSPACPDQQYCSLVGPACTTEPCEVHAVCRDLPACSASVTCPLEPKNQCRDDPSDSCNPADGLPCPGRCYCTEGTQPCNTQVLDRRPSVCSCVTPGTTTSCLDVTCPGTERCDIVLGKAYCIEP